MKPTTLSLLLPLTLAGCTTYVPVPTPAPAPAVSPRALSDVCFTVLAQYRAALQRTDTAIDRCNRDFRPGSPGCSETLQLVTYVNEQNLAHDTVTCMKNGQLGGFNLDDLREFNALVQRVTAKLERLRPRLERALQARGGRHV